MCRGVFLGGQCAGGRVVSKGGFHLSLTSNTSLGKELLGEVYSTHANFPKSNVVASTYYQNKYNYISKTLYSWSEFYFKLPFSIM